MSELYDTQVDEMIQRLSRAKRVLVTTHVRPDGDALGSTCAMVLGMKQKGIDAEVMLLSRLPRKYAFVYQDHGIVHHVLEEESPEKPGVAPVDGQTPDSFLAGYDTLLVVDTGTWSQLPGVEKRLVGWGGQKLVIDHHLTQQNWADAKLVETSAGAAAEIVVELLERWGVRIDVQIGTSLFLAMVTDTGWFQHSNIRPQTLRLAAKLMEIGVDTDRLQRLIYQNERLERIALQARAMQSLKLHDQNRVAVVRVTQSDFEQTHADVPDTENLVNTAMQIASVEVSILLVEPMDNGPVRVSLRSKSIIDVSKVAEQFAGGGHARAAGVKLNGSLDEVEEKLLSAIRFSPK